MHSFPVPWCNGTGMIILLSQWIIRDDNLTITVILYHWPYITTKCVLKEQLYFRSHAHTFFNRDLCVFNRDCILRRVVFVRGGGLSGCLGILPSTPYKCSSHTISSNIPLRTKKLVIVRQFLNRNGLSYHHLNL